MARLSARRARTSMRLRALDARDRLAGRAGRLVPPRRLQFVGCGIGRLARALAGCLSVEGAYAGFDVDADRIAWCRKRHAHVPQFEFAHADVRNARFKAGGAVDPVACAFPFEDRSSDVGVMISVREHVVVARA